MATATTDRGTRRHRPPAPAPVRLSLFEKRLFANIAAALAGAKASACLADGVGMAHRIQDAAMNHVTEWRTRLKADRLRRRSRAKRSSR